MDYGKGGTTVHVTCLNGCGTEWDQYVPAGGAAVELCRPCHAVLAAAFWAAYDLAGDAGWIALQAVMTAEREAMGK